MHSPYAPLVLVCIVVVIFGSLFGTDLVPRRTLGPTANPTLKPTTGTPSVKPTLKPSVKPTLSPSSSPVSTGCSTYLVANGGVGIQALVIPETGSFPSLEFYRGAEGDIFAGVVTFNYLNGEIKGYFDILLNFPPPRPTQAEFRFSTSPSSTSSFPVVIPIPEGVREFETDWFAPDGCTPLPCTQTLYFFGRIPYCPDPTAAPTPPTNSPDFYT